MKRTERAEALSYTLSLANEYVREHAPLSDKSKRPSYHLTPEIGWMNDPNGFCSFVRREISFILAIQPV